MPRYIDADALFKKAIKYREYYDGFIALQKTINSLKSAQPADVRENVHGEWIERKVIEDGKTIEEWQSAKCSVCGKYHTTPYLYNFDDFNYCPNCGAKMEVE